MMSDTGTASVAPIQHCCISDTALLPYAYIANPPACPNRTLEPSSRMPRHDPLLPELLTLATGRLLCGASEGRFTYLTKSGAIPLADRAGLSVRARFVRTEDVERYRGSPITRDEFLRVERSQDQRRARNRLSKRDYLAATAPLY
jgi:hypothetical protein